MYHFLSPMNGLWIARPAPEKGHPRYQAKPD